MTQREFYGAETAHGNSDDRALGAAARGWESAFYIGD